MSRHIDIKRADRRNCCLGYNDRLYLNFNRCVRCNKHIGYFWNDDTKLASSIHKILLTHKNHRSATSTRKFCQRFWTMSVPQN